MRTRGSGEYPKDWTLIALKVKAEADFMCERCGHPHDPGHGRTLTVHHLDGDKANCQRWNLAALCQACHLSVQGRVFLAQAYMFEHSLWFKPHLEGYLKAMKIPNHHSATLD